MGTFNRIIANSMRLKLAPKMEQVIGPQQRGFMNGRNILDNVIELDYHHIKNTSQNKKNGGTVLFDFNAAFPSVSHKYMWATLEHLGIPHEFVRACKTLYT